MYIWFTMGFATGLFIVDRQREIINVHKGIIEDLKKDLEFWKSMYNQKN